MASFAQRFSTNPAAYHYWPAAAPETAETLLPFLEGFLNGVKDSEKAKSTHRRHETEESSSIDTIRMYAQDICEAAIAARGSAFDVRMQGHFFEGLGRRSRKPGGADRLINMSPPSSKAGLAQLRPRDALTIAADQTAQDDSFAAFCEALSEAETQTLFTIGGRVQMIDPLTLRFDTKDRSIQKLSFGPSGTFDADHTPDLNSLLASCDAATFGLSGQDILDKQYRDALKLDPSRFSVNFHPEPARIIDQVRKLLLRGSYTQHAERRLHSDVYKLNVYGPAGKFKSHVDTPRSQDQIGSLVVCLPYQHQGGELIIRHGKRAVKYDWVNQLCLVDASRLT